MRVVAIVTQLERAGAQTLAAWIERALAPELQLTTRFLYAKHPSDLFDADRALLPRRPRTPGDLLRLVRRLRDVARDADLVVAHTHYAIVLAGLVAPRAGARVVAVHHWPTSRYPTTVRPLLAVLRRRGAFVREVFVSEAVRDRAEGVVIRNPVPSPIAADPASPATDLLVVARHSREKGVDVAIRALPHLPGRRLTLIGTGDETERLRRLAARIGVDDRVSFAGGVDHRMARAAMSGCIVVVPSRWEAMPMVILEAIAADAELVTSDIAAHRFVIDADAVVPFAEGDPLALAHAIEAVPGRAARLAAGRARVAARQSESAIARRWRELLLDAAAERSGL
jgi:glycosyltransferase involved in cell wall biosynthesis